MSSLPKHNVAVVTESALVTALPCTIYGILMSAGAAKAQLGIVDSATDDEGGDAKEYIQTAAAGESVFLDFEKMGGRKLLVGCYCTLTAATTAQVTIWYD
jgi:hypothetical protein